MRRKNWELKGIFWIITLLFVGFLAAPILLLLGKSLVGEGGFTWVQVSMPMTWKTCRY